MAEEEYVIRVVDEKNGIIYATTIDMHAKTNFRSSESSDGSAAITTDKMELLLPDSSGGGLGVNDSSEVETIRKMNHSATDYVQMAFSQLVFSI
ncbi:unnamed protein product [Gongylonema pulchrum]|uniref:Cadherin domain-containing protein n=1 Tax=Gongylonema pulchrum TaxID=637853 RepID=A0A183CVB1_9BILA|nr:unnamed protein product [Gongylonema pulchrum]